MKAVVTVSKSATEVKWILRVNGAKVAETKTAFYAEYLKTVVTAALKAVGMEVV